MKRLSNLMTDLLDYGKPPTLDLQPGGISEAVDGAVHACEPLARDAAVTVRPQLPPDLPHIRRDVRRLEQAFQNLLANAIQHSPRGSVVRVRARPTTLDGRACLECRVEDDGRGIPEASLPHVFEPFFTGRKGGTGLGLPIVQRIVEAHGGTVTAANGAEGGAVFTMTFPTPSVEARDGTRRA